jgi:hypothetical protein
MPQAQDDYNKAVVGVGSDGKAKGFMALTVMVEMAILHKCFQLDAYDYLVTEDPEKGEAAGIF